MTQTLRRKQEATEPASVIRPRDSLCQEHEGEETKMAEQDRSRERGHKGVAGK